MQKYIAMDLEIFNTPVEGVSWDEQRPFGISCASLYGSDWDMPSLYYMKRKDGSPRPIKMTSDAVKKFAMDINYWAGKGYTIVTVNGLGFDFRTIAEESQSKPIAKLCTNLAWSENHIDFTFITICAKGYGVGLQALADGFMIPGKTEGMHGSLAPEMWRNGTDQDRYKVLEYVGQDSISTCHIAQDAAELLAIIWISQKGKENRLYFDKKVPNVIECLEYPVLDTSWMTNNIFSREKCFEWTKS